MELRLASPRFPLSGFLARLARDVAGNTLAIIAAALIPLLAIVGGGVDVSRGYLAQSRLQQACDAGVLAARKRAGEDIASGSLNAAATDAGNRFFDINFTEGTYGTKQRQFAMQVEPDYSVSGTAQVVVPTTIMTMFGYSQIPLTAQCAAKLDMPNTDVMMVLDTTGSMAQTNPGDSQPKIAILKQVVKDFYAQLEANKTPGTRTRYGFVPYSSNVNVGGLLKSDWMVDSSTSQVLVATSPGTSSGTTTVTRVSGTATTLPAIFGAKCPESNVTWTDLSIKIASNGDKSGRTIANGTDYQCTPQGGGYSIVTVAYVAYVFDWFIPHRSFGPYTYQNMTLSVKALKDSSGGPMKTTVPVADDPLGILSTYRGCIQERGTYEIGDYGNIDLTRALDLDIDLVPDPSRPETQWRPQVSQIYIEKTAPAKNIMDIDTLTTNIPKYLNAWQLLPSPTCPNPAKKLAEMSSTQVAAYVDALAPGGNTYHDIGMIWGGRLLSATGLFANENADVPGSATSRHLIFLTDGETATAESNLATYGFEAYDKRRWQRSSPLTLNQTVEKRFSAACEEVKKKNITVWFIAFGTSLNPIFTGCAGESHSFEAANAEDLSNAFSTIAKSIGGLRITK